MANTEQAHVLNDFSLIHYILLFRLDFAVDLYIVFMRFNFQCLRPEKQRCEHGALATTSVADSNDHITLAFLKNAQSFEGFGQDGDKVVQTTLHRHDLVLVKNLASLAGVILFFWIIIWESVHHQSIQSTWLNK